MPTVGFLATFLAGWFALEGLATGPPMPLPAFLAVVVVTAVLVLGQVFAMRTGPRDAVASLGLDRPVLPAVLTAAAVGATVPLSLYLAARVLDVTLQLRPQWPAVLLGALLFHGMAEELVWRGFVFAQLRRRSTFRRAVVLSMPLITLTHAAVVVRSGWTVGVLAMVTATVTCLPLAHLWERGGRTVWPPAILHGLVGSWQVLEPTYPIRFSVVVLAASTVLPLLALLLGGRTAHPADRHSMHAHPDHASRPDNTA
jgi:membrane protease YdiL (CAAX protease family)